MKVGRRVAKTLSAAIVGAFMFVVGEAVGIWKSEAAATAYRWAANAPVLGSIVQAVQANPLGSGAVVCLAGIFVLIHRERTAGIVDIRPEGRHGTKLLHSQPGESFVIFQPWFVNLSNDSAEGVSAEVSFWGAERSLPRIFCRWAVSPNRDAPLETTFSGDAARVDIPPGRIPSKLNLALRWTGESEAYAYSRENSNRHPDFRHPGFRIDAGLVVLKIDLTGTRARETFWYAMINADPPTIRPVPTSLGWGIWALLAVKRRRKGAAQASGATAGTAAQESPEAAIGAPLLSRDQAQVQVGTPLPAPVVTVKDWQELGDRFAKLSSDARADWNQRSNQTVPDWHIRGSSGDVADARVLCQLAGEMMLKSPPVATSMPKENAARSDAISRWLDYVADAEGGPPGKGYGEMTDANGSKTLLFFGSIDSLGKQCARACLRCSSIAL